MEHDQIEGISMGTFGNVLFLATAIFPSVDAFFTLFFVRRFRSTVLILFRIPHASSTVRVTSSGRTEGAGTERGV